MKLLVSDTIVSALACAPYWYASLSTRVDRHINCPRASALISGFFMVDAVFVSSFMYLISLIVSI